MGVNQFTSTMRGTNGIMRTSTSGVVETDNYATGDGFEVGGTTGNAFPFSINPAETIQELTITTSGAHIVEIHTVGGDVFDLRLEGAVGAWDKWETDKVVIRDPSGNGDLIAGGWAGE